LAPAHAWRRNTKVPINTLCTRDRGMRRGRGGRRQQRTVSDSSRALSASACRDGASLFISCSTPDRQAAAAGADDDVGRRRRRRWRGQRQRPASAASRSRTSMGRWASAREPLLPRSRCVRRGVCVFGVR